ncbi:hypothetical protein [Bartonella saheliensis]|uniref:hypothetical protein n=1 Tax=Bartonella saheliensis TaxID=1457016 RepID=UPI0011AB122E|nr:hypothetical protein [Bartonella saheliensis]
MKVIITKPMCVLGDNKSTIRLETSTPSNPFVEVSNQVYARLKRANAAKPFVDAKTTAKPDKAVEQIKQIEQEAAQTSSETAAEEIPLKQPKASKASKSPTSKKA